MTTANGKIVVETSVPVLGKVRGIKTLAELAGGPAEAKAAKPAVETRPMASRPTTPAPATGAPSAGTPVASDTAVAATEAPAAANGSIATGAGTDPDGAKRLLDLGRAYLNMGMKAKAAEKFRAVAGTYPGTDSAKTAGELLRQCQ